MRTISTMGRAIPRTRETLGPVDGLCGGGGEAAGTSLYVGEVTESTSTSSAFEMSATGCAANSLRLTKAAVAVEVLLGEIKAVT